MNMTKTRGRSSLQRAKILLEVSKRCALMPTLDSIFETLVNYSTEVLNCERGTLFLEDTSSGELFSRYLKGEQVREIRILNDSGIAGHVFQNGQGLISHDPYSDPNFNASVDEKTGFRTQNIICVPVRAANEKIIGVMQCLNRIGGKFSNDELLLLEQMTEQASLAIIGLQRVEEIEKNRDTENDFLALVSDINSEVDLSRLLVRLVGETSKMLSAERSTIFLNDPQTNCLFSRVAEGDSISEIRFPNDVGIAGSVYTSGQSLNIPYAYADLRFNPSFDRQTGFFTRSILCVPIHNKEDLVIGVTQVLNKKGGCFTVDDENRLRAFTAQVAIALENSQLFDDVQRVKNYNESILKSMSNGVITLNASGEIVTCNDASLSVWEADEERLVGSKISTLLDDSEQWLLDTITQVQSDAKSETYPDISISLGGVSKSVNLTVMPLVSEDNDDKLGAMLMFEDISSGKRMMSTMSRYMDPVIASQMLEGDGVDRLGGSQAEATVMFTDIRGFTTITEEYGAQGTVSFLNDYFSLMVECITNEGGMLDKFIGDAIMACFGLPIAHEDDPDRAVKASIKMIGDMWEWNEKRTEKGLKTVDMGIGLNTDSVVSGNIGSPKRMDYTVIGDGVNLAARLESACKSYSARILVSESTVSQLKGTYRVRDIDLVIVKGKTKPVRVFEVLDYHNETSFPNLVDSINYFNDAIYEYRSGNWNKAIGRFEQVLKKNSQDFLSQTYIDRCKKLAESPPKGEWDGVWVMTSK